MIFPVQDGAVPSPDASARHWPVERAALDAEIGFWLEQTAPRTKWLMPEAIDRALARSPGLAINPRALSVSVFQHAQVRRIGDPLFGDLYRLAAVLSANVAVVPVGAEYIGLDAGQAVLTIAAAVINPQDGTVIWFGIIAGGEKGVDSQGAVASAAQAFARAFADKTSPPANK